MITDYGVKALLGAALQKTPESDKIGELALMLPSDLPAGSAEKMDFLGMVPAMREWIGRRSVKKANEYQYRPVLKKFESTVLLPLDWVNNDKTGQVQSHISMLSQRYNPQWYGREVAALISAGESGLCFDGKAFFATDHSWGESGTYSNRLTHNAAVANAPTANEAAEAIVQAISAMQGFKDDRGEPINEGMTSVRILCPTGAIGAAVRQAVAEKNLDTGTGVRSNPVQGLGLIIDVVVTARITFNRMVIINTTPGAAAVVFLENKGEFNRTMKGPGSDFEHDNDAWEVGLKAVGCAAYGRPTDAVDLEFT